MMAVKATMSLPPEIAENTLFEYVQTAKMFLPEYGRPVSGAHVKDLAADFDPKALGVLYLSYHDRDDRYAILDGNHRKQAAELVGFERLPARVYIDLTYQQEAALYRRFNTVKQHSAMDKFRTDYEAARPREVMIVKILKALHLDVAMIGKEWGRPGFLLCHSALLQAFDLLGEESFAGELALLASAFPAFSLDAYGAFAIKGLAQFLVRFEEIADRKRVVATLQRHTASKLLVDAGIRASVDRCDRGTAWGLTLWHAYNHGAREQHRLPEWPRHKYGKTARAQVQERMPALLSASIQARKARAAKRQKPEAAK